MAKVHGHRGVRHWITSGTNMRWERPDALREVNAMGTVIYAVRRTDGVIKIGYTADLWRRSKEIGGEILAYQYASLADEKALHATLVDHRAHSQEYYKPTPEVMAVVNVMRMRLGLEPAS